LPSARSMMTWNCGKTWYSIPSTNLVCSSFWASCLLSGNYNLAVAKHNCIPTLQLYLPFLLTFNFFSKIMFIMKIKIRKYTQAGLILCDICLHDFTSMRLENLHNFFFKFKLMRTHW